VGEAIMIVPVIFACDENYAMPCGVAITSLLANRASATAYHVHILSDRLQAPTRDMLLSLVNAPNNIEIIEGQTLLEAPEYSALVEGHAYLSRVISLRLHAADLLPALDKAIYLDADLVVEDDLAALYNTELGTAFAAAVRALTILRLPPVNRKPLIDPYFNSGVLLLNLALMREQQHGRKLREAIARHQFPCHDQDALNFVFEGNVVWLSPRYNYCTPYDAICSRREGADFFGISEADWRAVQRRPAIIHYIYDKPWQYRLALRGGHWRRYFRMSPFRDTRLVWRFSFRVVAIALLARFLPPSLWPRLRAVYVALRYPKS
jgi:lipopolysaccharide biosynthesis glycosyltransferase